MPLTTDWSHRVQPLPPTVAKALAAHRPADAESDQLVFLTARGRPVNASWLGGRFQDSCAEAGLPRVVLHSPRATVAIIASASGTISAKTASALLGHSMVRTTQSGYAIATTRALRQVAKVVGDAVLVPLRAELSAETPEPSTK